MGTNFYGTDGRHIGKRSAAGRYCWDCDVTLCATGNDGIHSGERFLEECPRCGSAFVASASPFREGSVAVELGFAQPNFDRPTGVRTCSSFTWAQEPEEVGARIDARPDASVMDEYGREMPGPDFLVMLANNCPVQFTDSIGRDFS